MSLFDDHSLVTKLNLAFDAVEASVEPYKVEKDPRWIITHRVVTYSREVLKRHTYYEGRCLYCQLRCECIEDVQNDDLAPKDLYEATYYAWASCVHDINREYPCDDVQELADLWLSDDKPFLDITEHFWG